MTRVIVDGDMLRYWVGFACQKTIRTLLDANGDAVARFESAKDRNHWLKINPGEYTEETSIEVEGPKCPERTLDYILSEIAEELLPDECIIYLSGEGNFRKDIYPEYKANRKNMVKPIAYGEVHDLLVKKYGAIVVDGIEADDAVATKACECKECSVIVAEDKDFHQISNVLQYNPKTRKYSRFTDEEADQFLFIQAIMGDSTDNIKGIKGVGPVGAKKAIEGAVGSSEMYERALALYESKEMTEEDLELTLWLVYLLRSKDEWWTKPILDTGKTAQD